MTTVKEQVDFLKACTEDNLPLIYTDGAATHVVYLARVRYESPHKGPGEGDIAELTFMEAKPEDWGTPTGWREQAEFLHDVGEDIEPAFYYDQHGNKHWVYIERIATHIAHKGPRGREPIIQLRMIELWRDQLLALPLHYCRIEEKHAITTQAPDPRYDVSAYELMQYM
ncbi:MAG: hypothetical protein DRN91_08270 [Candidatus Alkanophagales archaeon]|nr:MAG: hypothetical protein DRN91_08270 [Candidatus Alkanophagales archaeon]